MVFQGHSIYNHRINISSGIILEGIEKNQGAGPVQLLNLNQGRKMEPETKKSPKCISPDGIHELEDGKWPFYFQCIHCFERFILISETVAKETGFGFTCKDDPTVKETKL